jgi:Mg2+-importing ATPase
VLATGPDGQLLIVGAPEAVLTLCTKQRRGKEVLAMDGKASTEAMDRVHALAQDGLRAVAVASRLWSGKAHEVEAADENELVFEGICAFADPPKPTAAAAIARLAGAGVRLKILSGDDPIVVKRLTGLVGLSARKVLSGTDIAALSDEALAVQVQSVDAYGRLERFPLSQNRRDSQRAANKILWASRTEEACNGVFERSASSSDPGS